MASRPFQQGSLDGLCGVYAVINAVDMVIDIPASSSLPSELFVQLTHGLGAAALLSSMYYGVESDDLERTMTIAFDWLSNVHGQELTVERPFVKDPPKTMASYLARLSKLLSASETGVIINFKNHRTDHWTVAANMTNRTIQLRDSSGLKLLRTSRYHLKEGPVCFRPTEVLVVQRHPFRWLKRIGPKKLVRVADPSDADTQAILAAMDEMDRIGRAEFQRKYRLTASGQMFVTRGYKLYDAGLVMQSLKRGSE